MKSEMKLLRLKIFERDLSISKLAKEMGENVKIKDYVVFSEDFSEAVQVSFALSRHDWSELQKSKHWHFVEYFLAAKENKDIRRKQKLKKT